MRSVAPLRAVKKRQVAVRGVGRRRGAVRTGGDQGDAQAASAPCCETLDSSDEYSKHARDNVQSLLKTR